MNKRMNKVWYNQIYFSNYTSLIFSYLNIQSPSYFSIVLSTCSFFSFPSFNLYSSHIHILYRMFDSYPPSPISYYTILFSNKDRCILQSVKTVKTDPNNPGLYSLYIVVPHPFPTLSFFILVDIKILPQYMILSQFITPHSALLPPQCSIYCYNLIATMVDCCIL